MIKLSVSESKWSSLLARNQALILYISIWKFDFGPEKLPGLSRDWPQVSMAGEIRKVFLWRFFEQNAKYGKFSAVEKRNPNEI